MLPTNNQYILILNSFHIARWICISLHIKYNSGPLTAADWLCNATTSYVTLVTLSLRDQCNARGISHIESSFDGGGVFLAQTHDVSKPADMYPSPVHCSLKLSPWCSVITVIPRHSSYPPPMCPNPPHHFRDGQYHPCEERLSGLFTVLSQCKGYVTNEDLVEYHQKNSLPYDSSFMQVRQTFSTLVPDPFLP